MRNWSAKSSRPVFDYGTLLQKPGKPFLLSSYHPSQQNTFVGKLTPTMMRAVFATARQKLHC